MPQVNGDPSGDTDLSKADDSEALNQAYQEHRKLLINSEHEQARLFDKTLATISGGALAISITFYKEIFINVNEDMVIILFLSWVFFISSLGFNLISFLTSMTAIQKSIKLLDDEIENGQLSYNRPFLDIVTTFLNWFSLIFCILGLVLLVCFFFINLTGG